MFSCNVDRVNLIMYNVKAKGMKIIWNSDYRLLCFVWVVSYTCKTYRHGLDTHNNNVHCLSNFCMSSTLMNVIHPPKLCVILVLITEEG